MRIVEILVGVNALLGIGAFFAARGVIRRGKRKLGFEDEGSRDDQDQ